MAGKSPKNPSEDGVFHHHPWPPWTRKKTPKNHGKITVFFYGKMMGKPWENGDLYGKIQHFFW